MDIQSKLTLWQERLRLQHWKIDLILVPEKLISKDYLALTIIKESYLEATIYINQERTLEKQESDLIHELLHLNLWFCEGSTNLEIAINMITDALINGYKTSQQTTQ